MDDLVRRLRTELRLPLRDFRSIVDATKAVELAFERYNEQEEKRSDFPNGNRLGLDLAQSEINQATSAYDDVVHVRSVASLALEVLCNRIEVQSTELARLQARVTELEALDRQAATYVESVICMKSNRFTGEPPYVGWKGLGLALEQDYAELDQFRAAAAVKDDT